MKSNQSADPRKPHRSVNRSILFGLILTVLTASGIFAWTVPKRKRPSPTRLAESVSQTQKASVSTTVAPPEDLEVVQVTLQPTGFDPKEITYPHKKFWLTVQNRSGVPDVSLAFDGKFAKRAKTKVAPKQRHFGGVVDLPPGKYQIREATHPEWVFELTITKERQ